MTELNDKGEFFGHDKIEGLATPDGGKTLMIANDSDFGLAGIDSQTPPFKLKPKKLANGARTPASSSSSTPPNFRPRPGADGVDQGGLTPLSPGKHCRHSTAVVAWSGDTTS